MLFVVEPDEEVANYAGGDGRCSSRGFAAECGLFRTPSSWTSSPSGADAGSHPRCWATAFRVMPFSDSAGVDIRM